MRELTSKDYKLLKSLCGLSQKNLRKTILSYVKNKYDNVYHTKDFIMAMGNIPIGLVAHMDTVFKDSPKNIYYDREQGVIWSPEGLGADDRAGVFLILKIIQAGLRPTVIFTTDEEKGALGAEALIQKYKQVPCDLNYIIQLDRRGTNDCVFYDCDNPNFVNYIEGFGFFEAAGTFSDISVICPEWGVAGVNLSVGYEDEHSYIETLHVTPLLKTLERVTKMLQKKDIPTFIYIPATECFKWWKKPYTTSLYYDDDEDDIFYCSKCHKAFPGYSTIPCKGSDGSLKYYCPDCCVDSVHWCVDCGEAFEADNEEDIVCPDCVKKHKEGSNIGVQKYSDAV